MGVNEGSYVLAMYDVRGIQNYIFKTAKVKDAIGASAIVENIIGDALASAIKLESDVLGRNIACDTEWEIIDEITGEISPKKYMFDADMEVQVLYIGGGNAYVMYNDRQLCININKRMSKYIIEHTYSLQLAVAIVDKTNNYADDYASLNTTMFSVKSDMVVSKPLGSLPVMDVEVKTGNPLTKHIDDIKKQNISSESWLKKNAEKDKRDDISSKLKQFENYVSKKGVDSTIAVIHIDGNNMGLRIRKLIQDEKDYETAINKMREISSNINHLYKNVFNEMEKLFNKDNNFILKILTAGDDITYITNGKAAIASVEYFSREISKKAMYGEDIVNYGFSVCAGVAYINSHFPFSIAYDVAEECCESAKEKAKKPENMVNGKIGNWFDFQLCKNVHTRNLDEIREKEYNTAHNEKLMIRPYELPLADMDKNRSLNNRYDRYEQLKNNIDFFQTGGNKTEILPRSHAKKLRNMYPRGKHQVNAFASFLDSRKWIMPDDSTEMYVKIDGIEYAKWYDALELIDDYVKLEDFETKEEKTPNKEEGWNE